MNYPQIMSPVPFATKSGDHVAPAPMGAPPMLIDIIIINNNSSFILTADYPQLIFYKLPRRTAQIQSNTKNQL